MSLREALARTILASRDFVGTEQPDDRIVAALKLTRVCVVADEANLSTISGQSAVATLSSLVLQMGCQLRLALPETEIQGWQPPLHGNELRSGLIDLAGDLLPGCGAELATVSAASELVFVLGNTKWNGEAWNAWRLVGDEWVGGLIATCTAGSVWHAQLPIGGLAAAALGAAEVYKAALRPIASQGVQDQLALVREVTVRLGEGSQNAATYDFGAIDCVSAGAITQSFAHALFRVPGVRGSIRVIEPGLLDLTNLNRYSVSRRSRLGAHKTQLIRDYAPATISISESRHLADVSNMSALGSFREQVIIGTDDIPSRWYVQSYRPRWLAVGATSHFLAVASEHEPGFACARCMHPRDDDVRAEIPTVSFTSYWGGLMLAARLLRRTVGVRCQTGKQALWLPSLQLAGQFAQHSHHVPFLDGCGCVVQSR